MSAALGPHPDQLKLNTAWRLNVPLQAAEVTTPAVFKPAIQLKDVEARFTQHTATYLSCRWLQSACTTDINRGHLHQQVHTGVLNLDLLQSLFEFFAISQKYGQQLMSQTTGSEDWTVVGRRNSWFFPIMFENGLMEPSLSQLEQGLATGEEVLDQWVIISSRLWQFDLIGSNKVL